MKNLFLVLLTAFCIVSAEAQTYRIEGGPQTFYLVQSFEKAYADGDKNVDETWTQVQGLDSLKMLLDAMYADKQAAEQKYTAAAQEEAEAKGRIKELRLSLDKPEVQRKYLKKMPAVATIEVPADLPAGQYTYDGKVFTPIVKEPAKKAAPKKKKQ